MTPNGSDLFSRGLKMNGATVRAYARAMKQGSKYVYQTVPRLLTIWLDLGEGAYTEKESRESVVKCHEHAAKAIREVPAYKACCYRLQTELVLTLHSGISPSRRLFPVWATPTPKRTKS